MWIDCCFSIVSSRKYAKMLDICGKLLGWFCDFWGGFWGKISNILCGLVGGEEKWGVGDVEKSKRAF